jgi:HEAT repeat protein
LSGIGEPGVRKLLGRFLLNEDPDAVSAAIEAIVEMGDGDAAPLLESLVSDAREVSLEDDEGEEGTVTIGELAREAITLLTEIAEPARGGGAEDNSRALDPNGTRTKGKRH